MEQYKNKDGTYTSPKNGKIYKSVKALTAHLNYAGHVNPSAFATRLYNCKCQYCDKDIIISNLKRHEFGCYLNPANIKLCVVCTSPIKHYKTSKGTCSRSCSNKHFRSGANNGRWNGNTYTSLCFTYHKKECIVCSENKIVAVHHNDCNHNNNNPNNLIPLCPTHHQYVHSRYKNEVQPIIDTYLEVWKQTNTN